jgi:hypothetical protein
LLDGKATPDSLWSGQKAAGDKATFYCTPSQMITKDNYKEYFNGYAKIAQAPLPYAG